MRKFSKIDLVESEALATNPEKRADQAKEKDLNIEVAEHESLVKKGNAGDMERLL